MKVALVTDYLNVYGGGERVVESLLGIYPGTDVFTSFYDPSKFSAASPIRRARVVSRLSPLASRLSKFLTFLLPFFFERLDLSGYNLVITVGTAWAKGVRTDHKIQKHIFYCLTPPRFLYGYPSETAKRNAWYFKPFVILIDHFLRLWDFRAAQRPDVIVSISEEVRKRVKKFYRRESRVVYPPVWVEVRGQRLEASEKKETSLLPLASSSYFLLVSRLAAYKGIEIAIGACNRLRLPLKIVGVGREESRLKSLAGPTIDFLGFCSDEELTELYSACRAVIFTTTDEDFGIVPVEANSFGKPVIAPRSGGVLETQVEGKTAVFYEENTNESLGKILKYFTALKFLPMDCLANAQRFSPERFQREFGDLVDQLLAEAKK